MPSVNDYLELHKHFEFSYFLIALLEVSLRNQIPMILSQRRGGSGNSTWYSTLPLKKQGLSSLSYALRLNSSSPEEHLPFSFWRFLLSNRNYGQLWLPNLHNAFPHLSSPKTFNSFKAVDKSMDTSLRLRNNVAHYNLASIKNMKYSQESVIWLLANMGVKNDRLDSSY